MFSTFRTVGHYRLFLFHRFPVKRAQQHIKDWQGNIEVLTPPSNPDGDADYEADASPASRGNALQNCRPAGDS